MRKKKSPGLSYVHINCWVRRQKYLAICNRFPVHVHVSDWKVNCMSQCKSSCPQNRVLHVVPVVLIIVVKIYILVYTKCTLYMFLWHTSCTCTLFIYSRKQTLRRVIKYFLTCNLFSSLNRHPISTRPVTPASFRFSIFWSIVHIDPQTCSN